MVVHTTTQEVKAGASQVSASLDNITRSCLKKKKKTRKEG
jgi:hypothetical protein